MTFLSTMSKVNLKSQSITVHCSQMWNFIDATVSFEFIRRFTECSTIINQRKLKGENLC